MENLPLDNTDTTLGKTTNNITIIYDSPYYPFYTGDDIITYKVTCDPYKSKLDKVLEFITFGLYKGNWKYNIEILNNE